MKNVCIGLFGTCGSSTFRQELFIPAYLKAGLVEGVDFYNPQVANWTPECAVEEAKHLAEDSIILFPVTGETYGTGSLAEVGFSILGALKLNQFRSAVIYVEPTLDEALKADPIAHKESSRARALVNEHLKKYSENPFVHIINAGTTAAPKPRQAALEEMLGKSFMLRDAHKLLSVIHG